MVDDISSGAGEPSWRGLYRVGGAAALAAGILFRRNLGMEISLLSTVEPPATVQDAFALLQDDRLLGLTYLHVFDVVNYLLVALLFLALYALLRRAVPGAMAVAAVLAVLGTGIYAATNPALSLYALSEQHAAAATDAERGALLAAGQALLAIGRFTGSGAHPGSAGYLSLLLVGAAGLIASVVMLRSGAFARAAGYVGIAAHGLDLAYCLAYALVPAIDPALLAVTTIPLAGLLYMVWHILVGWGLVRTGLRGTGVTGVSPD